MLSLTGMELLCSLVVQWQILLYLLSDSSRVNRLWLDDCCVLVRFELCADISHVTDALWMVTT